MRKTVLLIFLLLTSPSILTVHVNGTIPKLISYQGNLHDSTGVPLDTILSITFTVHDDSTGGDVKWSEVQPTVLVANGFFTVLLGSVSPLEDSVFSGESRWLGIKIGMEPEMTPRRRLTSVPFAYHGKTADFANYSQMAYSAYLAQWADSAQHARTADSVAGNVMKYLRDVQPSSLLLSPNSEGVVKTLVVPGNISF